MILRLEDKYRIGELLQWVKANQPASIEMTPSQFDWYKNIVNQRNARPSYKFLGIAIKVYEQS